MATFSETIRNRRKELNLTLSQLATQLNYSIPYLSELERGIKQPPLDVTHIADALQLDPTHLTNLALLSRRTLDITTLTDTQRRLTILILTLPDTVAQQILDRWYPTCQNS
jgi:transcriptional regulator with XRE-family HTH domain